MNLQTVHEWLSQHMEYKIKKKELAEILNYPLSTFSRLYNDEKFKLSQVQIDTLLDHYNLSKYQSEEDMRFLFIRKEIEKIVAIKDEEFSVIQKFLTNTTERKMILSFTKALNGDIASINLCSAFLQDSETLQDWIGTNNKP